MSGRYVSCDDERHQAKKNDGFIPFSIECPLHADVLDIL
jgi:hypothetical protein